NSEFKQSRRSVYSGDVVVHIDLPKFDAAFRHGGLDFYIGQGGTGEIDGRRARFERWLEQGQQVELPEVSVNREGIVTFINGRHRYAYYRDLGRGIPVSMDPQSVENARAHGLLLDS